MNPRPLFCLLLVMMAMSFVSFRWPVNSGTVTSTFCESRWDHFHDGMDMTSIDDKVYPVEPGKLLFYWDKALFPLENYPGGGNFKILEHRNGVYSLYMHLENGLSSKKSYTENDTVGMMGNTGHSINKHIHFSLMQYLKRVSVNPLKLLPAREDTKAPVLSEIAFHIGDKIIIVRDRANIRLTRHYPLLVKINDAMTGRENLGVYRLSVEFNGKKVLNKEFGSIAISRGRLTVDGKKFENLFDSKGYYKIEGLTYAEGENVVKVTASDYAGNTAEKEYTFNVKLD
ncbi:MAG TPA: M23 family metallopeptidase, partial [Spirochaetota bacterium]|nr:M23 family metallopeptidase [Spirochaetota bacterium]